MRLDGCTESTAAYSGSVLGQLRGALAMPLGRSDHFHFLPVVRELVAAIQTRHVGAGQSRCLGTARRSANGHGKTVAGMAAAEKHIYQFCDHDPTFQTWILRPGYSSTYDACT